MRSRVLLAFGAILALVVGSRAADDKKASQDKNQLKKETVAKPMTDKQKRKAEDRLRKELASPYAKWLDEEVRWIISDEERTAFKRLQTDDEKQAFIEQFWLRRDPTPDTEENEFKEEHYRRIAWANDRFASGIPGWKTDRGQIYIKFGPPDENDSHTSGGPGERPIEEGGGETTFFPYEIWRYRYLECCGSDVQIEFVDPSMTNEYHITMDPSEKDALARVPGAGLTLYEQMGLADKSQRFTRTDGTLLGTGGQPLPARYNQFDRLQQFTNLQKAPAIKFKDLEALVQSTIKYNLLPMRVRTDYFPITGSSVLTNLTIQFERKDLQYKQKDGVAEGSVNIYAKIETMTRRQVIRPIEEVVTIPPIPAEMLQQATQGSAIYQKQVSLAPGVYRLTVAAKDVVGGNTTTYEQRLDVPRFDDDQLAMSSLVLADEIQKLPTTSIGTGPFVIGANKVRPRVNGKFRRDEPLYFYLQLYNFQTDEITHKPEGEIQYEVVKNGTNEKVLDFSEDLTALTGGAAQMLLEKRLPLVNFAPGDYTLKIKVTDKMRNETLSPTASFTVL
ncbi:MAG TPA: GWxTD domain-containing protein [Bryobacteraceae bacterium]|jgi:GWxTD domain-containing protein|nr:GWxTD domain-containing protein [Bryobacteraceae bacterium]